jgi:hypothetical protein
VKRIKNKPTFNTAALILAATAVFLGSCVSSAAGGAAAETEEVPAGEEKDGVADDGLSGMIFFQEDFENGMPEWNVTGDVAVISGQDPGPDYRESERPFFGNNTAVLAITVAGSAEFLFEPGDFTGETALTFSFKTEIREAIGQSFTITVDGENAGGWDGVDIFWRKESILLSPGRHTIAFILTCAELISLGRSNAVYLDNLSAAPDLVDSLALLPASLSDCYIGMPEDERIRIKALALRSDGSVIRRYKNGDFGFTVEDRTGHAAGRVAPGGWFIPLKPGDAFVRARIQGKTVTGAPIRIHPEGYMRLPYFYPATGNTYYGYRGGGSGEAAVDDDCLSIDYPKEARFEADSFFALRGRVRNSEAYDYMMLKILKIGRDGLPEQSEVFYLQGEFNTRIWLRFGMGEYRITVYQCRSADVALDGQGRFYEGSFRAVPSVSWTVINTRDEEGGLYPSPDDQSDAFMISNTAAEVTRDRDGVRDKILAIHDWVVSFLKYRMDEGENRDVRNRQDALSVVKRGNGVCEGYMQLTMALLKSAGVRSYGIYQDDHAWLAVFVDGRYRYLDTTFDDPAPDRGPHTVSHLFFLTDETPIAIYSGLTVGKN